METKQIVVDKERQELKVVDTQGRSIYVTRCSTGSNTPRVGFSGVTCNGEYRVNDIYESSDFGWPDWDSPRKPYGPYMLELVTSEGKESSIAIHGTDEPEKLGKQVSHGCIRISNTDITKLVEKEIVGKGTLVSIIGPSSQNKFSNSCLAGVSYN